MKCAICGETGTWFFRVNHKRHGVVLVCGACLQRERGELLPLRERGGCC